MGRGHALRPAFPCTAHHRVSRSTPPARAAVKRQLLRAQYRLRLVVESSAFNAVFLAAILVNTVLLAIEHDGMSEE